MARPRKNPPKDPLHVDTASPEPKAGRVVWAPDGWRPGQPWEPEVSWVREEEPQGDPLPIDSPMNKDHPVWKQYGEGVADLKRFALLMRQENFLRAFKEALSIPCAAQAVGITVSIVYRWLRLDVCQFRTRFNGANITRAESLEERVFDVVAWATRPENFLHALRYPTLLLRTLERLRPEEWGQRGAMAEEARKTLDTVLKLTGEVRQSGGPLPLAAPDSHSVLEAELNDILGH